MPDSSTIITALKLLLQETLARASPELYAATARALIASRANCELSHVFLDYGLAENATVTTVVNSYKMYWHVARRLRWKARKLHECKNDFAAMVAAAGIAYIPHCNNV